MAKKEYYSPEEQAMQKAMDNIREEFSDFWEDILESVEENTPEHEAVQPSVSPAATSSCRKFRRRLIAACFVGVCLLSTALAIFINSDTAHAMKFAMEKKYYQAKGWVQATNPGDVDDENSITVLVTEEDEVVKYKSLWSELMVPEFMLEDYKFQELYIEKLITNRCMATYVYRNEDQVLMILMRSMDEVDNAQMWIQSNDVRDGIYQYRIWEDAINSTQGIEVLFDNKTVSVQGKQDIEELIKIVNGLQ